jgi:hypothetical protein
MPLSAWIPYHEFRGWRFPETEKMAVVGRPKARSPAEVNRRRKSASLLAYGAKFWSSRSYLHRLYAARNMSLIGKAGCPLALPNPTWMNPAAVSGRRFLESIGSAIRCRRYSNFGD